MKVTIIIITIALLIISLIVFKVPLQAPTTSYNHLATEQKTGDEKNIFSSPLNDASQRVTKKPFGIFITPQSSPVQPEKFTGYHTGVDFETFAEEANSTVSIKSICEGKVLYKQRVNGYGGVLIQSCIYNEQPITVLYGHLALASIPIKIGDGIATGTIIGSLGAGYSYDTDGERKHLHLGIHKGKFIELRGYVKNKSDLDQWIDAAPLLGQINIGNN